jgi:23S rRNA pseudouridine1911/1915/1917 synthase
MDARPQKDDAPDVRFVVPGDQDGAGLLEFLSGRLIGQSKAALRRMIGSGVIRVNGAVARPARAIAADDVITLPRGMGLSSGLPRQTVPIGLLYEGPGHLCINKPAGYPVLPGRGGRDAEFFESLVALVNKDAPPGGPYLRPHIVHRLDRQTSGVLLVAKTVEVGRLLSRQFEDRQVEKTYLAVIEGVLARDELSVDIPLARRGGTTVKMMPDARRGKPAVTGVSVAQRFGHFALLTVRPRTGRQHQIRVHLSAIGYPLAVDDLYGRRDVMSGRQFNTIVGGKPARPSDVLLERCPLHAASIRYRDPATGEPLAHEAPLPPELGSFLALLARADPPLATPIIGPDRPPGKPA